MNAKRGDGSMWFVALAIIAAVFLVGVLIFTGKIFNFLPTNCEKAHGECGPPGLDRSLIGGSGKGMCENPDEVCYLKLGGSGNGNGGSLIYGSGIPDITEAGLVLERIIYEETMRATPWTISIDKTAVYVEPEEVDYFTSSKSSSDELKPGDVITFRGFINSDESMDICSLSIREVFEGDEFTSLPRDKPILHKDVRCDRVPLSIHFHPGGSKGFWNKDYEAVLRGKKAGSVKFKQEIKYKFSTGDPPKEPKANSFDGKRTDIDELKDGGYIGKPVSFALENKFGYIEVNNVVIRNPDSLNFDQYADIQEGASKRTIRDGLEYNYILFDANIFGFKGDVNFEIKIPYAERGDKVKITRYDGAGKEWFNDNPYCRDCKRIEVADEYVAFTAEFDETSGDTFTVVVENCKAYDNRFGCAGYSLMSQDLACTWTDPYFTKQDCEGCKFEGVSECKDYNAEFSCIQNSCSLQGDCYWNTKRFWRDSCQSCDNAKTCNDYESKDSCNADPCGITHANCKWSDDLGCLLEISGDVPSDGGEALA